MSVATLPASPCLTPQHVPDGGVDTEDDETKKKYTRYCCMHCGRWMADRPLGRAYADVI